jgi:hypothetical protein
LVFEELFNPNGLSNSFESEREVHVFGNGVDLLESHTFDPALGALLGKRMVAWSFGWGFMVFIFLVNETKVM